MRLHVTVTAGTKVEEFWSGQVINVGQAQERAYNAAIEHGHVPISGVWNGSGNRWVRLTDEGSIEFRFHERLSLARPHDSGRELTVDDLRARGIIG